MCCNDVNGWVNTPNPSSSPCTTHISLSALIIHVRTLWEIGWEVLVVKVWWHIPPCIIRKPPFHGWLTWWKLIGGPGKWWSDMTNNFHYVSVTLSHSLINFPLAVICLYVLDHRGTVQMISLHWLQHAMGGIARKERTSKYCRYPSLR